MPNAGKLDASYLGICIWGTDMGDASGRAVAYIWATLLRIRGDYWFKSGTLAPCEAWATTTIELTSNIDKNSKAAMIQNSVPERAKNIRR